MTAPFPRTAYDLAGFALSHGLWSIAPGEALCTLAVLEAPPGRPALAVDGLAASIMLPASPAAEGPRTLLRFEAAEITASIDTAHAVIQAAGADLAWSALVWDGYHVADGQRTDALAVEVAHKGQVRFLLLQRYLPAAPGVSFALVGGPLQVIDGTIDDLAGLPLQWVLAGMQTHRQLCPNRRDVPNLEDARPAA